MSTEATSPLGTNVGWIGTGVMGAAMCGHLLAAGYRVGVYSRTKAKAQELLARGARWFGDAQSVAAHSEVVVTMVGFPSELREVIFGERGVLAGARIGSVLVDMTTSEPALARQIAEAAQARGVASVDAPVSGGDVGARNATLSIMIGGDEPAVSRVQPILAVLGKTLRHQGPAGAGQHTKLVNQILIASGMVGVCEALLYADRAGLDPLRVIESVGSGAAGSWAINNLGPRILRGDYAPGFFIEHFLKDMQITLTEARRMKLALPGLELAERLYLRAQELGHGRSGTQALYLALESLNQQVH